jgi:hypothetical protein
MRHHKKTRKRGGGMFDSVSAFFGMKPKPATEVLQNPTETATKATTATAEALGAEPTVSTGLPGADTLPGESKLAGGKRRRTRKHKKLRRRR